MGFFDELKELGRGIKDASKDLGKELGQIARETRDEIREDPGKFLRESAKEVAGAVVSVGKYVLNHAATDLNWQTMKRAEELLRSGNLSKEQRADFMERRRKATLMEVSFMERHVDRDLADDAPIKEVESRIAAVEGSQPRLRWYLGLPELGLDAEDRAAAEELLIRSRDVVSGWRHRMRDERPSDL